jgi:hypothetical protein
LRGAERGDQLAPSGRLRLQSRRIPGTTQGRQRRGAAASCGGTRASQSESRAGGLGLESPGDLNMQLYVSSAGGTRLLTETSRGTAREFSCTTHGTRSRVHDLTRAERMSVTRQRRSYLPRAPLDRACHSSGGDSPEECLELASVDSNEARTTCTRRASRQRRTCGSSACAPPRQLQHPQVKSELAAAAGHAFHAAIPRTCHEAWSRI